MLEADWEERGRRGGEDKIGILRSCWQSECLAVFHMSNKKNKTMAFDFFFLSSSSV